VKNLASLLSPGDGAKLRSNELTTAAASANDNLRQKRALIKRDLNAAKKCVLLLIDSNG
jgi:hypothetical protein